MADDLTVNIKRQPFDPHFVFQVEGETVHARVSRLDDNNLVAILKDLGTFKVDISGVGFWFVEKRAEPYHVEEVVPEIHGGFTERVFKSVAGSMGHHCGAVVAECRDIKNALFRRNKETVTEQQIEKKGD